MDQWNQSTSQSPPPHMAPMGVSLEKREGEMQYLVRQVTDEVRYVLCHAIGRRPPLWDNTREKCNATIRKTLMQEVADEINHQYVLNPPINIDECEKHWKNLKDTYIKSRKKIVYDQEGNPIQPKWKFYAHLTFLDNSSTNPYGIKKRIQPHITNYPVLPDSSYDVYAQPPPMKKDKIEEIPTDEVMEFCRSLYLPLKEVGFKDRVQWLRIQKTIRDIVYAAQMESITDCKPHNSHNL